jgi:hypothetical protein
VKGLGKELSCHFEKGGKSFQSETLVGKNGECRSLSDIVEVF